MLLQDFSPSLAGQLKPQLKIAYETEMATKKDWAKAATMLAVQKEKGREERKAVVTASWKPNKPRHTPHIERYAKLNKVCAGLKNLISTLLFFGHFPFDASVCHAHLFWGHLV